MNEAKTSMNTKIMRKIIIWERSFVAKIRKNEVGMDLMADSSLRGWPWKALMTEYVIDPTAEMEKTQMKRV